MLEAPGVSAAASLKAPAVLTTPAFARMVAMSEPVAPAGIWTVTEPWPGPAKSLGVLNEASSGLRVKYAAPPAAPSTTTVIRTVTQVRRLRRLRRFSAARWERRRGPWGDPGTTSDSDISVTCRRPPLRSPPERPAPAPARRAPRGAAPTRAPRRGRTAG